jgi:hypothetical protein
MEGRNLRPLEAARAAVAACNLGLEHLLQAKPAQGTAVAVLERESADKLFPIGWQLLTKDVVLPAARAFESLLAAKAGAENNRERPQRIEGANRTLHAAVLAGKPWLALGKLAALEGDMEAATLTTLLALIDECPSLRGALDSGTSATEPAAGPRFIATSQQLRLVQTFLAGL